MKLLRFYLLQLLNLNDMSKFALSCLFSLLISTTSIAQFCVVDSLICDTCACLAIYEPVVGCDCEIYGNSCEALNSGVTEWYPSLFYVNNDQAINIDIGNSAVIEVEHNDLSLVMVDYSWAHGASGKSITVKPDVTTIYTVTISTSYLFSDGITSCTFWNDYNYTVNVNKVSASSNTYSDNSKLSAFPNPVDRCVEIRADDFIESVQIYDLKAVLMKNVNIGAESAILDLTALCSGMYYLQVSLGDHRIQKKIIKR